MSKVPTAIDVARLHEQEIRRLGQAMAIEQTQLSRALVGRKVRPAGKSSPEYRIVQVTFQGGGTALLHGCLWSRKRRHLLGDLNSVELIEKEATK